MIQIGQAEHNLTTVQKDLFQGTRVMQIDADAENAERYSKRQYNNLNIDYCYSIYLLIVNLPMA